MSSDLILFGAGFLYDNEEDELYLYKKFGEAVATTLDMQAIAVKTPGTEAHAVKNLQELLPIVASRTDKITHLRIFGHSDGDLIAFAGTMDPSKPDITFPDSGSLDPDSLKMAQKFITDNVRPRLADDAQITFYGCHSGSRYLLSQGLLQSTANSFNIPVRGFTKPLECCTRLKFGDETGTKRLSEATGIAERGFFRMVGVKAAPQLPRSHERAALGVCERHGYVGDLKQLQPNTPVVKPRVQARP